MPMTARAGAPLFEGPDWDFATLRKTYDAIEKVAAEELALDLYPNQIEIISAEQMLDAHSSIGMPLMYQHWSFGKRFVHEERLYRKGYTGLAYEIVINSNPCISYNMEQNTMAIQALVLAHAAFGHNHFFKNNYLFRQWTDAEGILEYLETARNFIARCEEKHGLGVVEETLDAAHALMDHAVFRYRRPAEPTQRQEKARADERRRHEEASYSDLWRTLPRPREPVKPSKAERDHNQRRDKLKLPEENLLFFVEQHSPILEPWQRDVLRIVRTLAQYFYPQKQTKVMNEGCATFVHHHLINALYDRGLIGEGAMLEILHNHANVVFQAAFDDQRYTGINPYALGFAMMTDIKRICLEPTAEDRDWFPDIAGSGEWRATLKKAWANFRDESFIQQYLSPALIRRLKLFMLSDNAAETHYRVAEIHDEAGYKRVREALAHSHDLGMAEPRIEVVDVDLKGDRHLRLQHSMCAGIPLAEKSRDAVLDHLRALWGYDVSLVGVDHDTGRRVYEAAASGNGG